MKLLFENWRKYLLSERKSYARTIEGPGGLVERDTYITLMKSGIDIRVYYSDKSGQKQSDKIPSGEVRAIKAPENFAPCLHAYQVVESFADDGFGPLLYDVVMEAAGEFGLMPDRESLSRDAYDVWHFYMKYRDDVQKKQLDDKSNELTDDPEDNCGVTSARAYDDNFDDYRSDDKKQALYDSPVMKVYTKGLTTIEKLEKLNPSRLIKK